MSDQTITLIILAVSVVVFVWNRLPVGIVALGVMLSLWATDVLTLDQVVEGFGSPTIVLIAALFVVAEALDAAGLTTWTGQQVAKYSGDSQVRFTVLVLVAVALLAALITTTGSVAALYPMVVVLAVRMGRSPSKYLMPVAFAGHAGSMLLLTGSAVTLLISEASHDAGGERFGFLELALVGVPLLVGTILVVVLFGDRLLPAREPSLLSRDLSKLPATLGETYIHEAELARLQVTSSSPLIGQEANKIEIPEMIDLHVLSVQDARARPKPDYSIEDGSVIVVRGSLEGIGWFAYGNGLRIEPGEDDKPVACGLVDRGFGVAEVIIAPRSDYIGDDVFPGMVTESGQLVVLAVQRHGEDLGVKAVKLRAGDSLLLQGSWESLDTYTADPNVVLVDDPDAIRRQTVPLGEKAIPALLVLAGMAVLLMTGVMPAMVACLLAAMAMVLLRVVTVDQAHRSMQWTTLILVAGMIPLSTAIAETGAADAIAETIVDAIGGGNPYVLMLGLFIITAVLGQMISNTATALVLIPIVASVAVETDLSVTALMMCINVAAAAALMTPVATPANVIVMAPAGYRFTDYWKLGLAVMAVYLLVGVFLVPVFWPL